MSEYVLRRRQFLASGAVLFGGAALGGRMALALPPGDSPVVVFDARYGDAWSFAHSAASYGARPAALDVDVVAQWSQSLGPLVRQRPAPVVGLTTYADFVLLRGLAAEVGQRLLFHAYHTRRSSQRVEHRILRGEAWRGALADCSAAGNAWMHALAAQLVGDRRSIASTSAGAAVESRAVCCTLHSWRIG